MKLEKVAKFIAENGVKPGDAAYHTARDVEVNGELKGKIRVLVLKADNIARMEYICPKCSHHGYSDTEEWKRPFSVPCEGCEKAIKVPKLRDQAKREAKKSTK